MSGEENNRKGVEFASGTKEHDGNFAPSEERPQTLFFTQDDEAEDDGAGDTSVIGGGKAEKFFLTQTEDLPTLFKDPERRGSIQIPHIAVTEVDDDGNETLTPVHFFQDDGSITIGSGLNYPKKCNVALSKKRNDKYMNHF